jgi:hypothetical protein
VPGARRDAPALHLYEFPIELLGGAAVLHAFEICDLEAQLLELKFLGNQEGLGDFELAAALENDALKGFDIVRQLSRLRHAPSYQDRDSEARGKAYK